MSVTDRADFLERMGKEELAPAHDKQLGALPFAELGQGIQVDVVSTLIERHGQDPRREKA